MITNHTKPLRSAIAVGAVSSSGAFSQVYPRGSLLSWTQTSVTNWELIHILVMTAVAGWLRLPDLGTLSLYGDEDYTILAVQAILTDGFPHMPSGMGYWRAIPYSYIAAASSWWFGLSAFSIRLPSAIFGALTVPVFYAIARRLTGAHPAALASWLLVFSAWHVDVSREGRMYAMFLAFFLLSIFYLLKGLTEDRTMYKVLAFFVSSVTVTLHHLGSLVCGIWLIAFLIHIPTRPRFTRFTGAAAATGLLGLSSIHNRLITFDVPGKDRGGMTSGLLSLLHLDYAPKTEMLLHFLDHHAVGYACLVILVVAFAIYVLKIHRPTNGIPPELTIGLLGVLTLALLNLFGLILLISLIAVFWYGRQVWDLVRSAYVSRMAAITVAMAIFWIGYGLFFWQGGGNELLSWVDITKKALKQSVYYPSLHVAAYASAFPVMTMIVLAGTLFWGLAFHEGRSSSRPEPIMFGLFWFPLMALGFKKEWIYLRYTIMVYPFYVLIFSWTIIRVVERLRDLWTSSHGTIGQWLAADRGVLPVSLIVLLLVVPVINEEHGLADAYDTSHLGYTQEIDASWHGFPFHPDHESAGIFVKSQLGVADIVIAMDVCQQHYYIGRVDYWLTSLENRNAFGYLKEGRWYDIYTASPVLTTEEELEGLLNRYAGRRVWLITSAESSPPFSMPITTTRLSEERFIGRDGQTRVFVFDARA